MKRIITVALLFFCAAQLLSQPPTGDPYIHKFQLWGKTPTDKVQKLMLYMGFTNGLYVGLYGGGIRSQDEMRNRRTENPALAFMACIQDVSTRPSYEQAVAMIDKYYQNNPEKWDTPFFEGIMAAILVKDGPCSR